MKNNNKGYSVIIALLITGFLLLLVSGVFNLVLKELNDTRAMGDYYKAYYGAEAGEELALLKIKEKGYGIDKDIIFGINDDSVILSNNPSEESLFNPRNEVFISYSLNTKTESYTGILDNLGYDIIPLFYIDETQGEKKINNFELKIISGTNDNLVWNIVSKAGGISGIGEPNTNIDIIKQKEIDYLLIEQNDIKINEFLPSNETNYLILFNSGEGELKYNLSSANGESFTKPKTNIISSAKIGNYRQNLSTSLDNTEYLNILKYSIYSN